VSASATAGQGWTVAAIPGAHGDTPAVAIDNAGAAVAVWNQGATLDDAIRPAGSRWVALGPVARQRPFSGPPSVLVDPNGLVLAGWRETGGLESSVLSGLFG
jgi:hypothetical protein